MNRQAVVALVVVALVLGAAGGAVTGWLVARDTSTVASTTSMVAATTTMVTLPLGLEQRRENAYFEDDEDVYEWAFGLTDSEIIWCEMTGDRKALDEQCKLLALAPDDELSRAAAKDPRDFRVIDPACGSMHFGLYTQGKRI